MNSPGSLLKDRFKVAPDWSQMSLQSIVFGNARDAGWLGEGQKGF